AGNTGMEEHSKEWADSPEKSIALSGGQTQGSPSSLDASKHSQNAPRPAGRSLTVAALRISSLQNLESESSRRHPICWSRIFRERTRDATSAEFTRAGDSRN